MSPRKLATPAVVQQHKWALANGEWITNSFSVTYDCIVASVL